MDRVDVAWSGGSMGSGLSVLFFKDGTAASHLTALRNFFGQYATYAPSGVSIRVPASGVQIDNQGHIVGQWTGAASAPVPGSITDAPYAAGVGARIRWYTGTVMNGHHVVGSTFLNPLATSAYQSDGSIVDSVVNALQTACSTLVTAAAGDFVIWTRPKAAGAGGGFSSVTSGTCPDRVSWLKSRRT